MKILVIGAGSIGRKHLGNLYQLGLTEVTVVDPNPEHLLAWQARGARVAQTLDELNLDDFSAALICSPGHCHLSQMEALVEAACPFFVEKPVVLPGQSCDDLVAQIEAQQLPTLVGCNSLFNPYVRRIKQLIDQKTLGRLYQVHARFGHNLKNMRPDSLGVYAYQRNQGGGALLDCASHELVFLDYWLGAGKLRAYQEANWGVFDGDIDEFCRLSLTYPEQIETSIELNLLSQVRLRQVEIVAEAGTLIWQQVGKPIAESLVLYSGNASDQQQHFAVAEEDEFVEEMRHFFALLRGQAESVLPVNKALGLLNIQQQCLSLEESSV